MLKEEAEVGAKAGMAKVAVLGMLLVGHPLTAFPAGEGKAPKFSLRLTVEGGSLAIGDLNTQLRSFNNNPAFEIIRRDRPVDMTVDGKIDPLGRSFAGWEGEVMVGVGRRLALGIAISGSRVNKSDEGLLKLTKNYVNPEYTYYQTLEYLYRPEFKAAAPIKLSLYYHLSPGARTNIYFYGGFGYYWGKLSEDLNFWTVLLEDLPTPGFAAWTRRHWESESKPGIGLHAGVGLESRLTARLALTLEVGGRYARIGNLRGTQVYEDNYPHYLESSGWLYYFTEEDLYAYGVRYANLEVWEVPPDGSVTFIADVRKASLNLSGMSLRLGIKMRLF